MKIVVSHPTGNRNVRAVISSLAAAGYLEEFDTTLAFDPSSRWLTMLPGKIREEWLRRSFPARNDQVWTYPYREIARMIFPAIGLTSYVKHETGWASIDGVYRDFDKAVARRLCRRAHRNRLSGVYAYEDGALATFNMAKELGLTCIYDLPIAYWETARKLLDEEARRLPLWAPTLKGGIQDSPEKLERKTRELELADIVIGPGSFVADSLPDWANKKQLVMVPFGSPDFSDGMKDNNEMESIDQNKRLRILFAGSLTQRKGLGDLFAAMKLLDRADVELVVMGSLQAPMEFYRREYPDFVYEPGRPHNKVLELMGTCDVFCLPSIVEGRALVMQEAMSQGLPLLITRNTGGEDLVRKDGSTGWVVPIRCPEQLAEKIDWMADHYAEVKEMGRQAKLHAAGYTWRKYGERIVEGIREYKKQNS